MKSKPSRAAVAVLALCACSSSFSQTTTPAAAPAAPATAAAPAPAAPNTSLATFGDSKITVAEFEASMLRVPERDRFGYLMSQDRINKDIEGLLRNRAVADEARRKGMDKEDSFKLRLQLYADTLLRDMLNAKTEEVANVEFETKRDTYLARAREQYLVNRHQYETAKEVRVSHILVDTRTRTASEALTKIKALRERVVAGEPFDKLAEANSDDASAKSNKGDIGFFSTGRMDPAFEAAAFALKKPMDISEPVRSQFGYHLIRLEDVRPSRAMTFEEVSPELMEKLRLQYVGQRQNQLLATMYDPAKIKWNEPAVVGLKKTVDPALYKSIEKLR